MPHTKEAIKDAVSRGYPVVYGKLIYDSFMSDEVARTGIIPLPDKTHEQMCMEGTVWLYLITIKME